MAAAGRKVPGQPLQQRLESPFLRPSSEVFTLVTLAVALALAVPQHHAGTTAATLPLRGVLIPGKALAGVSLGDSVATVKGRWGTTYRICKSCNESGSGRQTWFYTYMR